MDTEDAARQELEVALGIPVQKVNTDQFVIWSAQTTNRTEDMLIYMWVHDVQNVTLFSIVFMPCARRHCKSSLRAVLTFFQAGLVIDPDQPWLCCRTDGITSTGSGTQLVEIKCPYILKDSLLINAQKGESFVPYIRYVNGQLTLEKNAPWWLWWCTYLG